MAAPQTMTPMLPRHWQAYIERIQARLVARKLLDVLETFSDSTAFEFCETILQGQDCNKISLGTRKQSDGYPANVLAYLLPNNGNIFPPVLFRDVSLTAGSPHEYPRPAASLLRKASDLYPPFCFLQFDPHDNVTRIRDKLCALVLYYALVSGINDSAMRWNDFEHSLFEALKYITNRAEYRQWKQRTIGDPGPMISVNDVHVQDAFATSAQEEISFPTEIEKRIISDHGEIVRSRGSLVKIRAGTKLVHFKSILGSKVRLLDQIPPTPVLISRQTLYPTYFPVRLRIGTFRLQDASKSQLIDVHVYLTGSGKATTRILAHDPDGQEMSWTFYGLQDVDLFEPFAQFATATKCDPRTQGNKIRQLVHYYFMIAENEGFMDAPPIQVHGSLLSSFCAACKSFNTQVTDIHMSSDTVTSISGESTDDTTPDTTPGSMELEETIRAESHSTPRPLIVRLRLKAELLKEFAGPSHHSQFPDSEGEEDETLLDMDVDVPQYENDLHKVQPSINLQVTQQHALEVANNTTPISDDGLAARSEVQASHVDIQSDVQKMDRDNSLGSCAMSISPFQQREHEVGTSDQLDARTTPGEAMIDHHCMSRIISRTGSPRSKLSRDSVDPIIERTVDRQRATSVISSNNPEDDILEETPLFHPIVLSSRPQLGDRHRAVSVISIGSSNNDPHRPPIIDLCSDDEDNEVVEITSDRARPPRPLRCVSDMDRQGQNAMASKGPKRKSDALSKDDDDDTIREVGGDGWRRASWSRSQASKVQ